MFCSWQDSQALKSEPDLESRLTLTSQTLMATGLFKDQNDILLAAKGFLQRLLISDNYTPQGLIRCEVTLIKAESSSDNSENDDYGLHQVSYRGNTCLFQIQQTTGLCVNLHLSATTIIYFALTNNIEVTILLAFVCLHQC